MTFSSKLFVGLALGAIAYAQQPTITRAGVTNAASYSTPDLPSGALAKGGMIVIKGTNLGPDPLQIINSFPLRTELAGTTVRAVMGGSSVDAYLVYTSATQVAAILPSNTPEGTGTLTVSYNGRTSATSAIRVVTSAFGIFTLNQAGSGPGVFQNANTGTDQPINTLTVGARPGQLVIIWGTGLGPVSQNEASEPRPGDLPIDVEVYVGGRRANVTYKGRSGCCAGIDQIVFAVPSGVEGCHVPVVVKTGAVVSNFVTMSVSPNGGACSDSSGLTSAQLESAQRTGTYRSGAITLSRSVSKFSAAGQSFELKLDFGSGGFYRFNLDQLLRSQGAGTGSPAPTVMGSCAVFNTDSASQSPSAPADVIVPVALDAGPVINVSGPRGAKQLEKQSGAYFATLSSGTPPIPGFPGGAADYLDPGEYTISNGSGGSGADAVGAFSVKLTMPQLVTWANMDSINDVTRSNGLPVTWSGGDPNGLVYIFGFSSIGNNAAMFYCTERTTAGQFTVPSYVLSTLPATTGQNVGLVSVNNITQPVPFTAPGLDAATVMAISGSQKTVTFR